jgi:hypothetical protein
MVGSADTHTALSTTAQDSFFGKVPAVEPTADPVLFEETVEAIGGDGTVAQFRHGVEPSMAGLVFRCQRPKYDRRLSRSF